MDGQPIEPNRTVLILDDEPAIVSAAARTLESANYTVTTGANAQEGLALAAQREFALILSDNIMPGMHGLEFLAILMKQSPRSRRILVTGYTDLNQALDAFNHGILHRYVQKPWDRLALLGIVNEEWNLYAQANIEERALSEAESLLKQRADMVAQAADLLRRAGAAKIVRGKAQPPERRLAVIVNGDVVGFSRLMGTDHESTMATLTACREVLSRLVGQHRGRIVNAVGDSVLAEFQSAVDAVTCACEIQVELGRRNASLLPATKMHFRFGINVGDVLMNGGDLYGDGVNVAARVQALAQPGGVCITDAVYRHVKARLPYRFHALGAKDLKNIADPVDVYAVITGAEGADVAAK